MNHNLQYYWYQIRRYYVKKKSQAVTSEAKLNMYRMFWIQHTVSEIPHNKPVTPLILWVARMFLQEEEISTS